MLVLTTVIFVPWATHGHQVFTQEVAILYKQRYWCDRRDFIYLIYIRDNVYHNTGCLKKFPKVVLIKTEKIFNSKVLKDTKV